MDTTPRPSLSPHVRIRLEKFGKIDCSTLGAAERVFVMTLSIYFPVSPLFGLLVCLQPIGFYGYSNGGVSVCTMSVHPSSLWQHRWSKCKCENRETVFLLFCPSNLCWRNPNAAITSLALFRWLLKHSECHFR